MAVIVFSGNSAHTMDAKGRVTVPTSYRETLGDQFTIGLNNELNAIALYPLSRWQVIEEELSRIPPSDVRGMRYVRMINGNSFPDSQLDAQGRVLVPPALREKVGLDKQIRFVGAGLFLEIWDEKKYAEISEETQDESAELTQYVYDRYYKPKA